MKCPYSLVHCHVGAMLVFRMLCRITQSSDAHRTESVSVMDHEQTMGMSSTVLDQKQQNKNNYCVLKRWCHFSCTTTRNAVNRMLYAAPEEVHLQATADM